MRNSGNLGRRRLSHAHLMQPSDKWPVSAHSAGYRADAEAALIADLLGPAPSCRVDREQLKVAISLAFSSGVAGGLFTDALERAALAHSTWEPDAYQRDIFLIEFVARRVR